MMEETHQKMTESPGAVKHRCFSGGVVYVYIHAPKPSQVPPKQQKNIERTLEIPNPKPRFEKNLPGDEQFINFEHIAVWWLDMFFFLRYIFSSFGV